MKILICGFPHCGTSILKSVLGHTESIYEHPYETTKFPTLREAKGKHILIKFPFTYESFFKDTSCIKIFIIRSPYYVFSSLNKRFNYNIPKNHSIEQYEKTAKLFLEKSKDPKTFCIKYEDLFSNDYAAIRNILNSLRIPYSENIFDNEDRDNKILSGIQYDKIKTKPKNSCHGKYRTYQINQKFENMNDTSKIDLTDRQITTLGESSIIKQLGYKHP